MPPSRRASASRSLDLLGRTMAEMTMESGPGGSRFTQRVGEFECAAVYLGTACIDPAGAGEVGSDLPIFLSSPASCLSSSCCCCFRYVVTGRTCKITILERG